MRVNKPKGSHFVRLRTFLSKFAVWLYRKCAYHSKIIGSELSDDNYQAVMMARKINKGENPFKVEELK